MGGSLSLDMDYDSYNELYTEAYRVSQKEYTCCECGVFIRKGVRYQTVKGRSDGRFWEFKTCATCATIRTNLITGSFVFTCMWDFIGQDVFLLGKYHKCLTMLKTAKERNKQRTQFMIWEQRNRL